MRDVPVVSFGMRMAHMQLEVLFLAQWDKVIWIPLGVSLWISLLESGVSMMQLDAAA